LRPQPLGSKKENRIGIEVETMKNSMIKQNDNTNAVCVISEREYEYQEVDQQKEGCASRPLQEARSRRPATNRPKSVALGNRQP